MARIRKKQIRLPRSQELYRRKLRIHRVPKRETHEAVALEAMSKAPPFYRRLLRLLKADYALALAEEQAEDQAEQLSTERLSSGAASERPISVTSYKSLPEPLPTDYPRLAFIQRSMHADAHELVLWRVQRVSGWLEGIPSMDGSDEVPQADPTSQGGNGHQE